VQNRTPGDRDPEVLSEPNAARLLARASELDELRRAGSTVAELRAAAAEAGISAPAFDAALTELQQAGQAPLPDVRRPPRRRLGRVFTLAVASMLGILFGARMLFPVPGSSEPAGRVAELRIPLRCLTPDEATELVEPLLGESWNSVSSDRAISRGIIVRATQEQLTQVQALLAKHEREGSATCNTRPAP
jgi:hypothetical protein